MTHYRKLSSELVFTNSWQQQLQAPKYFFFNGFFFFQYFLQKISKLFDLTRISSFIRQCIHSTFKKKNELLAFQQTVLPVSFADSVMISSIKQILPSLQGTVLGAEHSHKIYLSVKIIHCLRCKYLQYGGVTTNVGRRRQCFTHSPCLVNMKVCTNAHYVQYSVMHCLCKPRRLECVYQSAAAPIWLLPHQRFLTK